MYALDGHFASSGREKLEYEIALDIKKVISTHLILILAQSVKVVKQMNRKIILNSV
jgi:hypothetical protein